VWKYSSGTTNILSRVVRERVGGSLVDYFSFPRKALFGPLGMQSAVIEPDAAGTFVGSSFMYATVRDWARFGLLYLRKGRWDGKQVLDEAWINYTLTPTPGSGGLYGAYFWLRMTPAFKSREDHLLPPDAYFASGHEGQVITIVPSRHLVVVRLGLSRLPHAWDHASFIARLLEVFPGR
jgi:CubicO group peptidase (beta-lactamase class C family)